MVPRKCDSVLSNVCCSGPLGQPKRWSCAFVASNATHFSCRTQAGIGRQLVLSIYWQSGSTLLSQGSDVFAYPAPAITPGTLRLSRQPSSQGAAFLNAVGFNTGDQISFDGARASVFQALSSNSPGVNLLDAVSLGAQSDFRVFYGEITCSSLQITCFLEGDTTHPRKYACVVDPTQSTEIGRAHV